MAEASIDKITMKDMQFYGRHGVMKEETVLGQPFCITIILHLPLERAGKSDDLDMTVNYGLVYADIKYIVEECRYHLLEALAEAIADRILVTYSVVQSVTVEVQKPHAPIPGIFSYMAVEITRKRLA